MKEIPRSTLMHVSLACSSGELRTMESIINFSRSGCSLPVELLLLIRAHLLIELTDHLIVRSSSALQRYETSLRYLLCPECIAYNQEVFGNDVWGWEQFSGACACFNTRYRSISSPIAIRRMNSSSPTLSFHTLDPKKFTNRHHWLEFYLSMKAHRLIQNHPYRGSVGGDSKAIWDLVSRVLEGYGCQSIRAHRSYAGRDLALSSRGVESCLIVPQERLLGVTEDCTTLQRVERDLALSVEYDSRPTCGTVSKLPRIERLSFGCGTSDRRSSVISKGKFALSKVANSLQTVFLTALSIPLSIVTLFLTIVCFYYRPWAFRIL
ncbi:hypothetical protein F5050DRAFT_1718198 [Lentinula boryana]|uniref:F-box domain-containing protein n=1 Tax=Lentinula boryana TaxID=40481 RepID=A0ABQ8QUZ2_9AGAR|nr:hypothetical protein F5050DRAFT_1718198 [Lentinula boryana]